MQLPVKYTILTLTTILISVVTAHSQEITSADQILPVRERNLYLQIQMLKTNYLIAEPVYFYVRVESRSDRTEYLTTEELEPFVVADSLGHPLRPSSNWLQFDYRRKPFQPGVGDGVYHAIPARFTTPRATYNVLDYYGLGTNWVTYYLPVGKYLLWSREMPSDTVAFSVVDPASENDKMVAERLVGFFGAKRGATGNQNEDSRQFFDDLLQQYSQSTYAQFILTALISLQANIGGTDDDSLLQEYCLKLLLEHAPSPAANLALAHLVHLSKPELPNSIRENLRDRLWVARDSLLDGRAQRDIDSLLVKLER